MAHAIDVLKERGFVKDISDEEGLRAAMERQITFYIGFDATAPSLHVGHLLQIMAMAWMQRSGHRPIALMGGGTTLVGDPTGRTTSRPILTPAQIDEHLRGIKGQFQRFLDFSDGKALMLNNADWLTKLNYIEFLRDVGVHFSVNQMLATDTYRTKIESESGLSFLEFNYALLQAYDFLHQYRHYNCILQCGGSDQWANSLAGADLIRKVEGGRAYVMVFPLITTSSGAKMGKTAAGAVWLDPNMTSPYDYYQFWINVEDADVERFLAIYTFLPIEKVRELGRLEGADLRGAKEVLAFEATKNLHGEQAANEARAAARTLFVRVSETIDAEDAASVEVQMPQSLLDAMPTTRLSVSELADGMPVVALLAISGLVASKGEARRLIQQGGAYINGQKIDSVEKSVSASDLLNGSMLLRAGKKKYHRVVFE